MRANLRAAIEGVDLAQVLGPTDIEITSICHDSRKAGRGSLFVCIKGAKVDGSAFAGDAVSRGAVAALATRSLDLPREVTQLVACDVRRALAGIASRFFGRPSERIKMVGVTGTNGKTTTAHYVRSVVEAAGGRAGVMGTLGHWVGDGFTKDAFTTPEAPEVQEYLSRMVRGGLTHGVMEVSSHAIALRRADQVNFDVVAFTNLTRDHLDFHEDLEAYKRTKMELFGIGQRDHGFGAGRKAAINVGDATGRLMRDLSPLPGLTFAVGADADVRADIEQLTWQGIRMAVTHEGKTRIVETALRGRINAENSLAAYTVGLLLGLEPDAVARGIAGLEAVSGRMEYVEGPDRQAIVDYAHTPDALQRLLAGVREIRSGRIICVFGCGGDRDRGKRPQMAKIAADLADFVIVTSDNPRTEDPIKIIQEIVSGLPAGAAHEVVPDRARAIERAVALSGPRDVIVIAGKGHEDYQIIGQTRIHFDDREVVRKAFEAVANAEA
jgi:UDP-N-acetylmuramoyl-L-alanyl-D-glutamate--2,6-diaminopimelate ligase